MSVLPVFKVGHPVIRQVAEDLTPDELRSDATQRLIDDMTETMRSRDGVGIAAPQVGVSKRIAVLEYRQNLRYPGHADIPLMVVLNARVMELGEETVDAWEGCLSVDNLRGVVTRSTKVVVDALDREGQPQPLAADGFLAVILQHEIDHLDGKVFLDRMKDLSTLTQLEEWYAYWDGRRPVDPAAKDPIGTSGIDHVGLVARDLEASRAWFVDLFGMREHSRSSNFVCLRVNEQYVFLLDEEATRAREGPNPRTALAHLALRVTREEFDRALETLAAKGIAIDEGPRQRGAGRSIYFKDPSGNQIELHHP